MPHGELLEALQAIPERIADIEAVVPFELLVLHDRNAGLSEPGPEPSETRYLKRNVRLPGRHKVLINAKVQLQCRRGEPGSASAGQIGWLRNLLKTNQLTVERQASIFSAGRYGDLNMVEPDWTDITRLSGSFVTHYPLLEKPGTQPSGRRTPLGWNDLPRLP